MTGKTNTTLQLASRMDDIGAFHVMAILARAQALEAEGRSVVHMEIGEPDFPTPEPVWRAAQGAIEGGNMFYTAALGLPELRHAIGGFYKARYGVDVPPERIVVTSGSSGALLLAIAILVGRDDEVLLADPGYPANRHFIRMMEGRAVGIPVGADTGYQLTAELIDRHWSDRTVAALVASPSNPTGTLIPDPEMREMARVVKHRGGALMVDEIYHGLVYGDHPGTALALQGDVFVINSFSKYFNMTGWRLGWMVAPESALDALNRLSQNVYLSAPTPSQYAALAAFSPETIGILEARRREFQARRDYLVPALRETGFVVPQEPGGAFYVYADCSAFTNDSYRFAMDLLEQAGVAITPGIDFGDHRPERHVRFAYTRPVEVLSEGVARIRKFVGR